MTIQKTLAISATLTCVLFFPMAGYADTSSDVSKAASSVGKEVSDSAITTKVKTLLALEPDIRSFKISVTTKNGVVWLKGKVDTGLQADKAVQVAQGVSGVKDVNNSDLKVKQSGSYTEDAFVTAKVIGTITQLSTDNRIKSNDLHVETTNGVVHIHGTVSNSDDTATVKKAVSAISGVKSVETDISVK